MSFSCSVVRSVNSTAGFSQDAKTILLLPEGEGGAEGKFAFIRRGCGYFAQTHFVNIREFGVEGF
jgi:hypothetical protein